MTAQADIVDAWIQHPTPRMLSQPMFESLRRWAGGMVHTDLPLASTIAALDQAGVRTALVSAWYGPQGALISNDEVAGWAKEQPDRLVGIGSADLARPLAAVRELRRCVKQL